MLYLLLPVYGKQERWRAYGLYAMAADLGATIGPVAGAWPYQGLGPQAPFVANAMVLAVCAGVLALWLRLPSTPQ